MARISGGGWTTEQTAELMRMRESGASFPVIADAINAQFGTSRTRKSCSSHHWDHTVRRLNSGPRFRGTWSQAHDDLLNSLLRRCSTHAQIADELNRQFGTSYSRGACIGRANRLHPNPNPARRIATSLSVAERQRLQIINRREKRWAANPTLEEKYKRQQNMAENRKRSLAMGHSKTSRSYRVHMPKIANMTKGELRAMLSQAVQNTAAMGIAA